MQYRPDIDGLRAVAVVAVMLYHFGIPMFPGGYVGVDVFFVVSGYLITGLIYSELQEGKFLLADFYDRRIRRILPALTVVVAATFVAGWVLLLPKDLEGLGQSVAAVAAFGSNFLFWREAGYFAPEAHQLPLLHTWSLAVEEQFYVIWPLLLVFLTSTRARWLPKVGVIAALVTSLALGEWLIQRGSFVAAFYLSPVRAWELMMGAALALGIVPAITKKSANESLALLGVAFVLYPVFAFGPNTPFPGLSALFPCVGTALLIHSGTDQQSAVARILTAKPVVFVGLISYSLYLWHWPFVAYFHYFTFRGPTGSESAQMILVCSLLAAATWKYVEQPFRRRRQSDRRAAKVIYAGLGTTAVTLVAGAALYVANGAPDRLPQPAQRAISIDETLHPLARKCLSYVTATKPEDGCLFGETAGGTEYEAVLWGDSHAAHYMPAIEHLAQKDHWTARQMSMAGCAPLLDPEPRSPRYVNCPEFNRQVLDTITGNENIALVILAARWTAYTDNFESIEMTVAEIVANGRRVLLAGQIPEATFPPDRCLALSRWFHWEPKTCDISSQNRLFRLQQEQNRFFRMLAQKYNGVEAFIPFDHLCDDDFCRTSVGDTSMYFDKNHFHPEGARYLARFMNVSPPRTLESNHTKQNG